MKKLYSTPFAAMGMAACFTLGLQGTANAAPASPAGYELASEDVSIMGWPTGCHNEKSGNGWAAWCTNSNGGHYKATVTCEPFDGGSPVVRDAAVWQTGGRYSLVGCPPLTVVHYGGIITKAS